MSPSPAILVAVFVSSVACGQIPAVGGNLSDAERNAPFPSLLPINTLLDRRPAATQITPTAIETLNGRIAALRNRAARLSGPVVDAPTRAKMRAAIARAALR